MDYIPPLLYLKENDASRDNMHKSFSIVRRCVHQDEMMHTSSADISAGYAMEGTNASDISDSFFFP